MGRNVIFLSSLPEGFSFFQKVHRGLKNLCFCFSSIVPAFKHCYQPSYSQQVCLALQWVQNLTSPVWVQRLSLNFSVFPNGFTASEPSHNVHNLPTPPGPLVFATVCFLDPDKLASAKTELAKMEKVGFYLLYPLGPLEYLTSLYPAPVPGPLRLNCFPLRHGCPG